MSKIVRAVRRANLALDRVYRHRRAFVDASGRYGDPVAAERALRLLARAEHDLADAQRAMQFPWEV